MHKYIRQYMYYSKITFLDDDAGRKRVPRGDTDMAKILNVNFIPSSLHPIPCQLSQREVTPGEVGEGHGGTEGGGDRNLHVVTYESVCIHTRDCTCVSLFRV